MSVILTILPPLSYYSDWLLCGYKGMRRQEYEDTRIQGYSIRDGMCRESIRGELRKEGVVSVKKTRRNML